MNQSHIERARETLRASFGYPAFRPGQERAVESVLGGRDTLVVLPTGGGKSLCYQVPALMLPGLTVVVSPLISLMKDQVDALTARGLPAAFINSTLSQSQSADRFTMAARGEIKLLYVAPERFDQGTTAERLRQMGVSLLAIDEAHCISEWGHDFRPSYLRMAAVRARLGDPPTIALTATATPEVRADIARQLHLADPETIVTGFDRTNLTYHVVPANTDDDKDAALVAALREHEGLAVVYASTRKAVERITRVLDDARIDAVGYHAGLDDTHRHEVQDDFMKENVRAIVATNAFGMGIDKPNVRLVVHHAMPATLEAYYQEAGRAGRDGLHSHCVLLHAHRDRFTTEFFIKGAYPSREIVASIYDRLQRSCDATGLVRTTPEELAGALPGKVGTREIESAMRILAKADALRHQQDSPNLVMVRLLAHPDRIKRELAGERDAERELLRALWRAAPKSIYQGAVIDLDALPGFGGARATLSMLEHLQSRQFLMVDRTGGGTRLTRKDAPLSAFDVDWDGIDRRRAGELGKLDAMQRYAYTKACRRAFVLRYFGDPAARVKCEGCDNCLGLHKGKESAAPRSSSAGRDRADRPARASRRPGRGADTPSAPADYVVGPDDAPVFAALRALRARIARDEQVPAYVVFPDRTLAELAVKRPRTLTAMGDVRGVGPAKLDRYGQLFLDALREAAEQTDAA